MSRLKAGPVLDALVARALDYRQCVKCGAWMRGETPGCVHDASDGMAAGAPAAFSHDVAVALAALETIAAGDSWRVTHDRDYGGNHRAGYGVEIDGITRASFEPSLALAVCRAILAAKEQSLAPGEMSPFVWPPVPLAQSIAWPAETYSGGGGESGGAGASVSWSDGGSSSSCDSGGGGDACGGSCGGGE